MGVALAYDPARPPSIHAGDRVSCGSAIRRGKPGSKRTKNRLGIMIYVVVPKKDSTWAKLRQSLGQGRHSFQIQKKISDLNALDLSYLAKLVWEPDQPMTIVDQIADLA